MLNLWLKLEQWEVKEKIRKLENKEDIERKIKHLII